MKLSRPKIVAARASRRGWTLIEMVVVASLSALIVSMATTAMWQLRRVNPDRADALLQSQTLARLASRFRTDVHQARSATLAAGKSDNASILRLDLADEGSVEYEVTADGLTRTSNAYDAVTRHDSFLLPGAALRFELDPPMEPQIARLLMMSKNVTQFETLDTADPMVEESPIVANRPPEIGVKTLAIEAALARDYRFVVDKQNLENATGAPGGETP